MAGSFGLTRDRSHGFAGDMSHERDSDVALSFNLRWAMHLEFQMVWRVAVIRPRLAVGRVL